MKILILFFLLLLAGRLFFFFSHQPVFPPGQTVTMYATVIKSGTAYGKQRVTVNNAGTKLFITTTVEPQYFTHQKVAVKGIVEENVYDTYTMFTMSHPEIVLVKDRSLLHKLSEIIIQRITTVFESALPPIPATLLLGIVLGVDGKMPDAFADALQTTGVLHVIAASGMNVSMVGTFLLSIFGVLVHRKLALLITSFGILFYMVLAGFEPAIVRASIMAIIAIIGSLLGRQQFALWALGITGYLMLFVDPSLLGQPGFQLSFLATCGIMLLVPVLSQKKLPLFQGGEIIATDIRTTIAAQVATMPIVFYHFGSYGLVSVLANALVLWTIPILMLFGGLAAIISWFSPFIATVMLWLALPFLLFFQTVIEYFGKWSGTVTVEQFPLLFVAGYYFLLVGLFILINKKKAK